MSGKNEHDRDQHLEQIPVILSKLEDFEKHVDEKFVGVNIRLDRVESLRDRVVILETEADARDKRLGICERGVLEVQKFFSGLGWKSAALLLSIVMNLVGCIYAIYTIRTDRNEETIKQHILEDLRSQQVVQGTVSKPHNETVRKVHR